MKRRPCIYKNLAREMFVQSLSITDLARSTFVDYKLMCKKLNGTSVFTVEEAIQVWKIMGRVMPIEQLFERDDAVDLSGQRGDDEDELECC